MSHFDPRRFKVIPDLPLRIFFYTSPAFDYFFSYSDSIIYPPAILPCSQNWEKARREWQSWLEGKLMMVWGRRRGSFRKLTFFLSSGLGWNGLKKNWTPPPHGEDIKRFESQVDEEICCFRSVRGRGVSIISEWPLVHWNWNGFRNSE